MVETPFSPVSLTLSTPALSAALGAESPSAMFFSVFPVEPDILSERPSSRSVTTETPRSAIADTKPCSCSPSRFNPSWLVMDSTALLSPDLVPALPSRVFAAISAPPSTGWGGTASPPGGSSYWFFGLLILRHVIARLGVLFLGFFALFFFVLVFGLLGLFALFFFVLVFGLLGFFALFFFVLVFGLLGLFALFFFVLVFGLLGVVVVVFRLLGLFALFLVGSRLIGLLAGPTTSQVLAPVGKALAEVVDARGND